MAADAGDMTRVRVGEENRRASAQASQMPSPLARIDVEHDRAIDNLNEVCMRIVALMQRVGRRGLLGPFVITLSNCKHSL